MEADVAKVMTAQQRSTEGIFDIKFIWPGHVVTERSLGDVIQAELEQLPGGSAGHWQVKC